MSNKSPRSVRTEKGEEAGHHCDGAAVGLQGKAMSSGSAAHGIRGESCRDLKLNMVFFCKILY